MEGYPETGEDFVILTNWANGERSGAMFTGWARSGHFTMVYSRRRCGDLRTAP